MQKINNIKKYILSSFKKLTAKNSKGRMILKIFVIALLIIGLLTKTYSWLYEEYVGNGVTLNMGKISHLVTHYDENGTLIQDNEQTQTLIYETNLSNLTKNTKYIKIENNGTLDLEYTLSLSYEGTVSSVGVLYYRLYEVTEEVNNAGGLTNYATNNPIPDNIETDGTNPIKNMTLINSEVIKGTIELDPISEKSAVYYRLDYGMYQTVNTGLYSEESMSLHFNVYSTQIGATEESALSGQIWQVANEQQLREILISATNGDTIQLIDSFTVAGTIDIGKRINLDTNDHELTITGDLIYDFANMGDLLIDVTGTGVLRVENNLYINVPKAEVDIIGGNKLYDIVVGGTTTLNGIQDGEKDGIYLENLNMVKSSTTLVPLDIIIRSNTRLTIAPNVELGIVSAEVGSTNIEVINNGNIIQLNFSDMSLLNSFTKAQIYVYNLGNIYGILGSTSIVLPKESTPYIGPNNGNTWIVKGITSNDITVSGSDNFKQDDIESNLDDVYVVPIEGEDNSYIVYIKDSLASVESLLVEYFTNEGYERPYEQILEIRKLIVWTLNAQYFENEDFDFLKSDKVPSLEHLNLENSRIIDDTTVNRIKTNALKDKTSLKTLLLPSTITEIGDYAFYNVPLGKIPTSINEEFNYATIPSSVTTIGDYAYNASEYIYLESNNPPTISANTFDNALAKIFVNAGAIDTYLELNNINTTQVYQKGFLSDDRKYIVFEYNNGLGISYVINNVVSTSTLGIPTQLSLKGTYKKILVIGTNSYRHMNIYNATGASVVLPSTVVRIDKYAFYNLNITSISLTNVEEVKAYAFYNTKINMLQSSSLQTIGEHAFENTLIKELSLSNISYIGDYAFNKVETMYSAYLYNVSYIGDYAFNDCKYLNKVYFSNTNTKLINNSEQVDITVGTNATFSNWGFYTDGRLRVYVPDGKTESGNTYLSLYQKLFTGNENYIFITGYEIGSYTHMALPYDINIYTVREITLKDKNDNDINGWEIVSYQGKDLGNDYTIPESLTYNGTTKDVIAIGDYAYRNVLFEDNTTINIQNESLVKLGNYSLANMDITNIKAPNITEIGTYALYNTELQTAEFENLKSLGDYAFAELLTLNMINLGKVENIGYSALYNDANLEQVFINNTDYTIVLGTKAFYNVGVNAGKRFRMYVPSGETSLNYYKTLFVDFSDYIYETGIILGSYINAPIMYDIGEYSVKEITLKDRDGQDITGYKLIEYHGSDLSNLFELPDKISTGKNNLTVTTNKTGGWQSGTNYYYTYDILITNNSTEDITDWKIKLDTTNMTISGLWNVNREDFDNYSLVSNSSQYDKITAGSTKTVQIQFYSSDNNYVLSASYYNDTTSGTPLISIGDRAFINTVTNTNTTIKLTNQNLLEIGNYAFYNIKGIKELNLPKLTTIGDYAFYNSELNKVETPNLKSVGSYALSNMSDLYYINLGRVIEMKENSLYNLNNLLQVFFSPTDETIVFDPNSITNVGSLTNDRIRFYVDKVKGYEEVTTTEELDLQVTYTSSYTTTGSWNNRKRNYTITATVANPSSKDISNWNLSMGLGTNGTFNSVTSGAISSVNGSTVTFNGDGTTSTIPALGSVKFIFTVKTTNNRAWSPTFDTPKGTHINKETFETDVEVVNTYKNSFNEMYRNYFYTKGKIIGTYTPNNIPFEIGEYSVNYKVYTDSKGIRHNGWEIVEYHGPDIEATFTIPETLTVEEVTLPLISIGEYAFRWAKMNSAATFNIYNNSLLLIDDYALYGMGVNNLNTPNLDVLGNYALYNNAITIANMNNLYSIGDYALANNNVLNYVNLGKVEKIGASALENCTALEQIFISTTNVDASTITANITIGENAFNNIATIIGKRFRIYVPDGSITSTSTYKDAYRNTLPKSVSSYIYETGILINDYQYSVLPYNIYEFSVKEVTINNIQGYKIIEYHGPDITSDYELPNQITIDGVSKPVISIGQESYYGVEVATNENWDLVIPNSILIIEDRAFYKTGITSISSNATLESIGVEAFAEMPNLTNANIGEVKYIKEKAFYLDKKLATLRIGSITQAIATKAFYNTYDDTVLTRVYIATETPPTIEDDSFPESYTWFIFTYYKTYFYVPRQSVDNYKSATNWSNRRNYINSSAELYNNTYYYSKNDDTLEVNIVEYIGNSTGTLTIPNTFRINNVDYKVTSIDGGAFDSSNVMTIILPANLTSIGEDFLNNNNSVININVDSNNQLFASVDGVLYDYNKETLIRYPKARTDTSYTLDNSTKVLANGSFASSISLTTINFNQGLLAIGTGVFTGSNSLQTMNFTSVTPPYLMGFGSFPTNYNLRINYPTGSENAYTNNLFYYSYKNYLRAN